MSANKVVLFAVFLVCLEALRSSSPIARHDHPEESNIVERTILALSPSSSKGPRPVLTVELLNGLGNQLFQVAALLSVALDHSPRFAVALPDVDHLSSSGTAYNRSTYWHSVLQKLRPLLEPQSTLGVGANDVRSRAVGDGRCIVEQVARFDPLDKNCSRASVYNKDWAASIEGPLPDRCGTMRLRGYFQDASFFRKHLTFLRELFWNEATVEVAKRNLAALVQSHHGPVVSVHYRLKDYEPNGWVLSRDYYDGALSEVTHHLGNRPLCMIVSDDPQRAWQRSAELDGCIDRVLVPHNVSDVESFYMMSLVDANIIADSSFSYFAALLGRANKRLVVAPTTSNAGHATCWPYLASSPWQQQQQQQQQQLPLWITLPAEALSPAALLEDEIMGMATPDAD